MEIILKERSKEAKYKELLPQLEALMDPKVSNTVNLLNLFAALKYNMNFFWAGCYIVKNNQLELGPFQGPTACTTIAYGKGVCGRCWELKKEVLVDNVHEFDGHIACSSESNSELVLPVILEDEVKMILDFDSEHFAYFNNVDVTYLGEVVEIIKRYNLVGSE